MPKLERRTRRLLIRPLGVSDYKAWKTYFETMSAPLNKWDRTRRDPSTLTRAFFKKVISAHARTRRNDRYYDLMVFERKSGAIIGGVSVMNIERGVSQSAYIGYSIHNGFWNRGYGKESVRALIDLAFRDLKLHRVEAGIEPTNRLSMLLAKSLGLRREGTKKRAVYMLAQWVDLVMYSATCEEFGFKWKSPAQPRIR